MKTCATEKKINHRVNAEFNKNHLKNLVNYCKTVEFYGGRAFCAAPLSSAVLDIILYLEYKIKLLIQFSVISFPPQTPLYPATSIGEHIYFYYQYFWLGREVAELNGSEADILVYP